MYGNRRCPEIVVMVKMRGDEKKDGRRGREGYRDISGKYMLLPADWKERLSSMSASA